MARNAFGGSVSDYVVSLYTLGSSKLAAFTAATLTFYDAETGGNQVTDLALNVDGTSPVSSIAVPDTGDVPTFYGPDGVTQLWVSANGAASRVKMVSLEAAADAVTSAQAAASEAAGHATDAASSATAAEQAAASVPATTDAAMAPVLSDPESASAGVLAAALERAGGTPPAWQPNTAYGVGRIVAAPDGSLVAAKIAFTSGAAYDANNWRAATTVAGLNKSVMGGQFPKPLRVPTLTIERMWPNQMDDFRPLHVSKDGETIYAVGRDGVVRKATNGGAMSDGATWTQKGSVGTPSGGSALASIGRANCFLKLTKAPYAGVLLSFRLGEAGVPVRVIRSTNDGATWTEITSTDTLMVTGSPMGVSSWREDPNTGYIYYGEYDASNTQTEVNVYRSTDGGQTWAKWYTFPGPATASANKVRHIHTVDWDPVSQRIVVLCGDDDPKAGLYRVSADGTTVEPWLTSDQITNLASIYGLPITNAARGIGFIPFPDYIAYVGDSSANPWLCRVKRSDLGLANPPVERVYQLNSSGWFAAQASDDGKRWVFSASQEAGTERLDNCSHLYAVEDQGATVYEVGTLPVTTSGFVTLAPLSTPDSGGDVFYLQDHNSTRSVTYRCRLAYGGGVMLPWPIVENRPRVQAWQTVSADYADLAGAATKLMAVVKVPAGVKYMRIFDMGVKGTTGQVTYLRTRIKSSGGTTFQDTSVTSERDAAGGYAGSQEWKQFAMTPGAEIYIMLENTNATLNAGGVGFVTFGWGTF